jgi:hypothetical protein
MQLTTWFALSVPKIILKFVVMSEIILMPGEIPGSHGSEYDIGYLLGCCAM